MKKKINITSKILYTYKKNLHLLIPMIISDGVISVIMAFVPYLIGITIKNYLEVSTFNMQGFLFQILIIFLCYVLYLIFHMVEAFCSERFVHKLSYSKKKEAFNHLQSLSMAFFDKHKTGDLISRFNNDLETFVRIIGYNIPFIVGYIIGFFIYIIAMINLSLPLTLVVLISTPLMVLISRLIGKKVRKIEMVCQKELGELNSEIQETINGFTVIKSYYKEKEQIEKFKMANNKYRKVKFKQKMINIVFNPLNKILTSISLAIIIFIGGVLSSKGLLSIGIISSFIMYSNRIYEWASGLLNNILYVFRAIGVAERYFEIIEEKPDVTEIEKPIYKEIIGNIKFENVIFGYDKKQIVLDNINFKADKGSITAIIGKTGAGKTTIINLLSRFYDVDKGEILIDGINIKNYNLEYLRNSIGVVLQEPFLFATTIKDNLRYGKPTASDEEIYTAAKMANADYFIKRLSNGYNTVLYS